VRCSPVELMGATLVPGAPVAYLCAMNTDPNAQAGADPALQDAASADQDLSAAAEGEAVNAEMPDTEQLIRERDEMRDRWLRAEAEIANVRARAKRDVDDTRQYAVQKFAADVVEAAENLRRGLASIPAPSPDEPEVVTKLRDGFEGVERAFVGILERSGIKRSDPTGQPYDANLHQAMGEEASAEHAPGTVVRAWTQAWTLNGRLLKPAMVVVAKRADEEAVA
jgi:molecular chaperone GrpE